MERVMKGMMTCEQELRWTERTKVKVTFKNGKVTDVFGPVMNLVSGT
jgi:hypothetical protein